jgi:hypothetical protein
METAAEGTWSWHWEDFHTMQNSKLVQKIEIAMTDAR